MHIVSSDVTSEGTECLYLREMCNGKVLALICRQVVFPSEHSNTEYRYSDADLAPRCTILQSGNKTHAELL